MCIHFQHLALLSRLGPMAARSSVPNIPPVSRLWASKPPHLAPGRRRWHQAAQAAAAGSPMAARTTVPVVVRPVSTEQQLLEFKSMTKSYLEWLGEDLGFQGIERELACLPGSYAEAAGGCMLLAYLPASDSAASIGANGSGDGAAGGGEVCVGAVALRRLAGHTPTLHDGDTVAGVPLASICEMKRLFVVPQHHNRGAGAALVRALLAEAARRGYRLMVLDTLERLEGANRLYAGLGFALCERYNDCPLPGVLYFARRLGEEAAAEAAEAAN